MSIGIKIKEERERLGYSQQAFSDLGGVSKRSQIMYEQDKTEPSARYFTLISDIGADIGYILTGKRSSDKYNAPAPQITNKLDSDCLALAIETVEEGLEVTHRTMKPNKKAELVMAVYDLFKDEPSRNKQSVVRLVQSAA
jgi:transcriptional regulator with XRE-family HTH domain